jgi:hypothetical protein
MVSRAIVRRRPFAFKSLVVSSIDASVHKSFDRESIIVATWLQIDFTFDRVTEGSLIGIAGLGLLLVSEPKLNVALCPL